MLSKRAWLFPFFFLWYLLLNPFKVKAQEVIEVDLSLPVLEQIVNTDTDISQNTSNPKLDSQVISESGVKPFPSNEREKGFAFDSTDLEYQVPSESNNTLKDLIPKTPEQIDAVQKFNNSQIFNLIQNIQLNPFYQGTIGPLPQPVQPQSKPQVSDNIQDQINQLITNAISNTAVRYPWIINSSDSLSFSPQIFKPRFDELYHSFDLQWSKENPVINKISFGVFPYTDQFYWVLDENRIIGEVGGLQGGLIYQGRETQVEFSQTMRLQQSFNGLQAVWVIPNDFQRLFRVEDLSNFQVITISGQLINPEGVPAGTVNIDSSSITQSANNLIVLPTPQNFQLGTGSTFSPSGGGALFSNLEVQNAPLILQAFPTTDLQALAGLDLQQGTVISKEILAQAGISWGNPAMGQPSIFNAPITSTPGIKIAQEGKFENKDLLNILVNPFLTGEQRDRYYLNSLLWLGLGTRTPELNLVEINRSKFDWYRFYFSAAQNRFMIRYDPEKIEATYFNLYSNPGVSFTLAPEKSDIDEIQSVNSTIGMMMGYVFAAFNVKNLDQSIEEAYKAKENNQFFNSLETKATSEQRRQMNQRLNLNLAYSNIGSNLNQVSGFITFPSYITPTKSSLFQIKTGNIRRAVQFIDSIVGNWNEGETVISEARFSNRDFGPLTFMGTQLPVVPSNINDRQQTQPINESSATQVILVSPEGDQFIQQFDSNLFTSVPIGVKIFDLAFDRFVLERIDQRTITNKFFNGYISLPTVELVYAGTSNDFSYSINTGLWFNIDHNKAGTVTNSLGIFEPSVGVYINALLTANKRRLDLDENGQVLAVTTHSPFLRFNWNSANNSNNPWQISLSHTISRQTRKYGYSFTGSLGIIPQYSNGPVIGLINGNIGFNFGLSANGNIELGDQIYYGFTAMQQVLPRLSLGLYIKNSTEINEGFNSRILELNYGILIEHKFPDSPISLTAQIGIGESGNFIGSVKGDIRW
ncbi:MAG: hypothetical protein FWJ34_16725 [Geminocystis sp. GBBB08]|nr:hypothetical protein [Geminocystis sp. GBBB08]